jgi:indole-3-glycerol phosphate synthase
MFLNEILTNKSAEFELKKHSIPLHNLIEMAEKEPAPVDFISALDGDDVAIIAEIKRASPSRGIIRQEFDPVDIAVAYHNNGAAAISVLTEEKYFMGHLEHLKKVKHAVSGRNVPVLRKDFIFDIYQIYESRAYGADCILLIVAMLKQEKLRELLDESHNLGMKCLVEVHNENELETALNCGAAIIGINNRDLNTFVVDISTTERLRPLIPGGYTVISESGIKTREDMDKLRKWRINAALVGEALMSSNDIGAKISELKR